MLSGNGRHRRPRQAPAVLVAAGVAGSAIAIPLLGATGASAASGTTWDRVAECESGGSWSADPGNGFYGGLQLTQADWEKYGGLEYAVSADQASRSQQIAVGEKILADQGAGAWEACALLSGLGKDTGSADVDTGVTEGDTSELDRGFGSGPGSGPDLGLGLLLLRALGVAHALGVPLHRLPGLARGLRLVADPRVARRGDDGLRRPRRPRHLAEPFLLVARCG